MTPVPEPFWEQVAAEPLRQGEYLPECPVPSLDPGRQDGYRSEVVTRDLVVLTQSCDLGKEHCSFVALCPIYPIVAFADRNPAFRRKSELNQMRRGRREGLHLLAGFQDPSDCRQALVVDFRQIYSLPRLWLEEHARNVGLHWRLVSPYLEHFSQAFARFFMRVGLPSDIPEFATDL